MSLWTKLVTLMGWPSNQPQAPVTLTEILAVAKSEAKRRKMSGLQVEALTIPQIDALIGGIPKKLGTQEINKIRIYTANARYEANLGDARLQAKNWMALQNWPETYQISISVLGAIADPLSENDYL